METLSYDLLCYLVAFLRDDRDAVALSTVSHTCRAAVTSTWGLTKTLHIDGGSRSLHHMQPAWVMRSIKIRGMIGPTTPTLPFTQLREVRFDCVRYKRNVSDAVHWLMKLMEQTPVLDTIEFIGRERSSIDEFELFVRGFSGGCKAKHVHFADFGHVRAEDVKHLTRYTCNLQSITISNCVILSDIAALYILRQNCATLTYINLSENGCLTDVVFDAIALCTNLKSLDLQSCGLLTDKGAAKLVSCRMLENADLYNNRYIGEDTFCMLVTQFPYLDNIFFTIDNGSLGKRAALAVMTNSNLRAITMQIYVCKERGHANWYADFIAYMDKQVLTFPTGEYSCGSRPCDIDDCDVCIDIFYT